MERRKFTREFKLEAVRLIKERGVSVAQASRDLEVHQTVLRNWVRDFADDPASAFPGRGQMKPEQLEIARLVKYIGPIEKITPYARNSRTHSDEQVAQIAASIREWGWTNPVLVDEDGGLIAGHGRVLAARKLGLTQIPTMVARGWSEAQKRAYVIADNRLALNAGWDLKLLAIELGDLQGFDFDLLLTGFSDDELTKLLADKTEGLTDPDEVPEAPVDPIARPGDVWLLGQHRLVCGDSTSVDDMEKLTAGQMADMWLTDPQYNVAYEGGTRDKLTIQNDNMTDDAFRQFLRDAYPARQALSLMRPQLGRAA